MYYITLELNEKGKQICNTDIKTLECDTDYEPSDSEIQYTIENKFMKELVNKVINIKKSFKDVHVGDIIVVHIPQNDNMENLQYGEITNYIDSGYGHEFTVRTIDDERINTYYYNNEYRFNFEGYQIGGKRKDKIYATIASQEEIIIYNNIKNRNENYQEVLDLLHFHQDYEYDTDTIPQFLNAQILAHIKSILTEAKDSYYNETENS